MVCGVTKEHGVLVSQVFRKHIDGDMFLKVVKKAHKKCPNLCIVMDNYSIHKKKTNLAAYQAMNIKIIWVPVGEYSLNSGIETTFLMLKTLAKRKKLAQVLRN